MSAETNEMTAREVRLCREAFVKGAEWQVRNYDSARNHVDSLYPMPTREVPRVLSDGVGVKWRLAGGYIEAKTSDRDWHSVALPMIGLDRLKIITSLFTSPTHRVEATDA